MIELFYKRKRVSGVFASGTLFGAKGKNTYTPMGIKTDFIDNYYKLLTQLKKG